MRWCGGVFRVVFSRVDFGQRPASVASRGRRSRFSPLLVGLLLLGLPVAARAVPITYDLTGGSATIQVLVGGVLIGTGASPTLSGSVTLDSATPSIEALDVTLAPNILMVLTTAYGGYDEITIETASVVSAVGFGPTNPPIASGSSYTTYTGPIDVTGSWGATNSSGTPAGVSGNAIAYQMTEMISVVGPGTDVVITGVTLHSLDGATFGEASDLTVVAVLNLFATPVPEPSSGLLAAWGLALLAGARRRRS